MPSTTTYRFGDVVLVDFPFTSLQQTKRRPAAIVSSDRFNQAGRDLVLIPVTGQASQRFGAVVVQDWRRSGLRVPSVAKPVFFSFEKNLIIRALGHLDELTKSDIRKSLARVLG